MALWQSEGCKYWYMYVINMHRVLYVPNELAANTPLDFLEHRTWLQLTNCYSSYHNVCITCISVFMYIQ